MGMEGTVEAAQLEYIIRDHNDERFAQKKALMQAAADFLNQRYGEPVVEVEIKDQYYNMRKMIEPHPEIVQVAKSAYAAVGLEPHIIAVRGGTDGSRLSYMGLPTPNIFAGGHAMHGRYEFVPLESMEKAVEVILKIAELATAN
jgi:tripeptide aminopeptidase